MKQPARTVYEYMGGEEGIRRLINRFYDLMDSSAEAANIRALHASSLKMSREKLFMFFSGWTGGPTLLIRMPLITDYRRQTALPLSDK